MRFISFIVVFVVFFLFIVFNLENKCDISFGFHQAKNVPVFVTAFTAFILGMLCAAPFILGLRKKKKTGKEQKPAGKAARGRRGGKGEAAPAAGDSYSDGGPYGVD